jgi:hypothetical protein
MRLPLYIAAVALWPAWAFASPAAPATASAKSVPKVVLVESSTTTAPDRHRHEIRATIEAAVRSAGGEVVAAESLPRSLTSCTGPECARELGRFIDAGFMMAVDAAYVDDGFKLRLEMYDTRTGRLLASDGQSCDICPFPAFVKALADRSSAVCVRSLKDEPAEPATAAASVPAPDRAQPVPGSRATAGRRSFPAARPAPVVETSSVARRTLFVLGIAAGLAGIGGGVYLITLDGDPACTGRQSPCPFKRDTRLAGGGIVAAGAVVALVSGYFYYTAVRRVEVGVGPGGIAMAGRF